MDGEHADGATDCVAPPVAPAEPGPHLWRTLRAQASGAAGTSGKEALLYTDSRLTTTQDMLDLGAATIQAAVGSIADSTVPAARVVLRWWEYDDSDAPLRSDYATRVDDAQDYWLGMHVDQEFAAVLSLLLGVRIRSGGTIRRYRPDDLGGRTDLVEHGGSSGIGLLRRALGLRPRPRAGLAALRHRAGAGRRPLRPGPG
jgi:hypothetical protein